MRQAGRAQDHQVKVVVDYVAREHDSIAMVGEKLRRRCFRGSDEKQGFQDRKTQIAAGVSGRPYLAGTVCVYEPAHVAGLCG